MFLQTKIAIIVATKYIFLAAGTFVPGIWTPLWELTGYVGAFLSLYLNIAGLLGPGKNFSGFLESRGIVCKML